VVRRQRHELLDLDVMPAVGPRLEDQLRAARQTSRLVGGGEEPSFCGATSAHTLRQ
jgi:hypothetical protein